MKAIIIEDEDFAVQRLRMLLDQSTYSIEVIAVLDGIKQAVKWLSTNKADIIFLDIHLSDGTAFKIFEQIDVTTPIIFTTAYHEYALRAFQQHSIDYLLKPVNRAKLQKSLDKLNKLRGDSKNSSANDDLKNLIKELTGNIQSQRFMVRTGNTVKVIDAKNILYFRFDSRATFLISEDNKKHIIDKSLKQLELTLSEQDFFRVNRNYLLSRDSILELQYLSASRVKVIVKKTNEEIIVAREKLTSFKNWMLNY